MLLRVYRVGELGDTKMPEDASPKFSANQKETRLVYFTLPMSLNYQRNSYKLWESVLKTFRDKQTSAVFNVKTSANLSDDELRNHLLKHKVALQPNKHIKTWQTISKTIYKNWGNINSLLKAADFDFLKLQKLVQVEYKKGFPYLSGPKIFHYWSFIIQEYGKVKLKNSEFIEIAPDTHITKASVRLGVITKSESVSLSKETISERWRKLLHGSGINPIDMHAPLWFWSRNGFKYRLS